MALKTCDCGGCFELADCTTVADEAMCDACEEAGCSCDSTECRVDPDFEIQLDEGEGGEFEGEDPHAVSRFLGFELAPQT